MVGGISSLNKKKITFSECSFRYIVYDMFYLITLLFCGYVSVLLLAIYVCNVVLSYFSKTFLQKWGKPSCLAKVFQNDFT